MAYNIRKGMSLSIRNIISIAIIIILVFAIKSSTERFSELSSGKKRLSELEITLDKEQKKNAFLKERLSYVQSDTFVEEEARNKLGLTKEGEYVVIAPPPINKDKKNEIVDNTPNWKKWWELFF